ncbi:hypothetical protein AVEN_233239-1 [Araneus ventricosus]|uniref:Transposase Tc1-like domain-containing protein n=1 Tax=Araneus ventricosus TaxID=182803 RepID=A0A4Y2EKJ5_ARAVE|nr:hypothetical protein AVEN_233239-1 [Araneus ventricosus]
MQERDQRRLLRIIKRDKRVTIPQIAAYFNVGPSTSVSVRTIQRNIIDMGFRSRRPTRVPLMSARYYAYVPVFLALQCITSIVDLNQILVGNPSIYPSVRAHGNAITHNHKEQNKNKMLFLFLV